jgi:D-hexose-6-phosphate mutarotase
MICVETTNAADDRLSVAPGEARRLLSRYRIHQQ